MIDASTIDPAQLKFTNRLIIQEAFRRGWKAWMYTLKDSHIRLQRPDGKQIEIFSAAPPTTSFGAAYRANNKFITHLILEEAGLLVPETYLVEDQDEAKHTARLLLEKGKKCVVKPLDAGHGNGITVNISSEEAVTKAYEYAQEFSTDVLVQEHLDAAIDIRVTCINYKYTAALVRVPARVKGTGEHSIRELIALENDQNYRGVNYSKELNRIDVERAKEFLGEQFDAIPASDAWVQVIGTANVGSGGETIDVTEALPAWLIAQAEQAAQASQLAVAGVDFMLKTMPSADMNTQDLEPRIIEVNKCPSLFIHEYPTHGKAWPATSIYFDYLETL